jgi:hypothetical protein
LGLREALIELLNEDREWRLFFKACRYHGAGRLHAQGWQFTDELADKGCEYSKADIEEALLDLARSLLPDSPAAGRDAEYTTT